MPKRGVLLIAVIGLALTSCAKDDADEKKPELSQREKDSVF